MCMFVLGSTWYTILWCTSVLVAWVFRTYLKFSCSALRVHNTHIFNALLSCTSASRLPNSLTEHVTLLIWNMYNVCTYTYKYVCRRLYYTTALVYYNRDIDWFAHSVEQRRNCRWYSVLWLLLGYTSGVCCWRFSPCTFFSYSVACLRNWDNYTLSIERKVYIICSKNTFK